MRLAPAAQLIPRSLSHPAAPRLYRTTPCGTVSRSSSPLRGCALLRGLSVRSATPPELLAAACALFPNAAVWSAYGMTEAASSITFQLLRRPGRAPEAAAAPGSVGRAAPGMEVRVAKAAAAPAQGACGAAGAGVEWAAPGEEGEVLVRGAQVCLGYWGDEQATAAALVVRRPSAFAACPADARRHDGTARQPAFSAPIC